MKKVILSIVILSLVGFTALTTELTKEERKFAEKEMTKTQQHLMKSIKGLSEVQLNFKSSPESWSIAECTEHIALSENNIFGMMMESLKTPADSSKRAEVTMTDEQILKMIPDRTNKVKTGGAFVPTGKFGSFENTVTEFNKKRGENIEFVKTTKEDLRNHYTQVPFGTIDAYQVLLFMSAHTERHVLQIEEVKANPNFPKE